jgi:muramoyltetrapeptide carboxypeptidase
MTPALNMISKWGYQAVEGDHLYGAQYQYSGSDQDRASDFQKMLDNDSIRAIFCARGGYGSVRIIDKLDFSRFKEKPKWIVGYSDITVFHSHINSHLGIQTLHATMPINFPADENTNDSLDTLKATLQGWLPEYHFGSHPLNRPGKAEGVLCGGNLSMLYSLIGSPSDINTEGKILFIEDLDEYLYHIDRMMMNLKRSGKLHGLSGIVVGGMNDMNDNAISFGKTAIEIIAESVADYNFPIIFNFKSGHISENMGLIVGGHVEMGVAEECFLRFS